MTLKLNGSSSGYTAIDAPATAGSNTLVLPPNNGSANQILQTDGSGNLTWVDKPTAGLSGADQWRITDSYAKGANNGDVTANWARVNDTGFIKIGTGLSESSGIFSFPETGIWWVSWILSSQPSEDSQIHMAGNFTGNNGTSWEEVALATCGFSAGSTHTGKNQGTASFLFDVTDTSNCKFKFTMTSVGGETYAALGSSDYTMTGFTVLRLGDT